MHSWEHFQVWTQAVSQTSSANRASGPAASGTHDHLAVTLSSPGSCDSNTQVQALVKFPSLARSCSSSQLRQTPVQFLPRDCRLPGHTQEVQVSRARSPGSAPLPVTAVPATKPHTNQQWRKLLTATFCTPFWRCFGGQDTPHLTDKPPGISALCSGNCLNKNYLSRSPFPVLWTTSCQRSWWLGREEKVLFLNP